MASKSYPDEFKIEAVRQVTDRGYKPKDVAERLGCTCSGQLILDTFL